MRERAPIGAITRAALILAGTAMLALGVIGIYVPGLPTTPFLLVAAACYMRSSERLYGWLVSHPRIGPPVRSILEQKAVPLKIKIFSLLVAWIVLLWLALFVVETWWLKMVLIALALVKTAVMLSIKTLRR